MPIDLNDGRESGQSLKPSMFGIAAWQMFKWRPGSFAVKSRAPDSKGKYGDATYEMNPHRPLRKDSKG